MGRNAPARVSGRKPAESVVERTVHRLTADILESRYPPGYRLVEADLTREFGVSRGPVREALRRLSAEGLIDLEPHRGAVVRSLSREDMEQIFEIRVLLEGFAAGQAARARHDAEAGRRMAAELEEIGLATRASNTADYLSHNVRFHRLIAELSNNRHIAHVMSTLQLPISAARYFRYVTSDIWKESLDEHRRILLAVREGNGELAEALMRAHVRRAADMVRRFPDDIFAVLASSRPRGRTGSTR